ncbi:MAG: GpE family phage tail protein [Paenirhodobacter sp.]
MGRHFHWQPSEIDDMPVEELLEAFERATHYLELEARAQ